MEVGLPICSWVQLPRAASPETQLSGLVILG